MREFNTPMMQQYIRIKEQYPDAMLFFRLGDFYELFLEDAEVGSRVLGITLTKRPRGKDGHIPMAGVPFHSADGYIAKLTKAGFRIAICEQISAPNGKDLVERSVVRIISPGAFFDENYLEKDVHNFTAVVILSPIMIGLALGDISTGDVRVTEIPYNQLSWQLLSDELARWRPTECIVDAQSSDLELLKQLIGAQKGTQLTHFSDWTYFKKRAPQQVREIFGRASLEIFNLNDKKQAVEAVGILLGFWEYTQQERVSHLQEITYFSSHDYVLMDKATVQNLELFETLRGHDKSGTLFSVINQTKTPMGGRLLRSWLRQPLSDRTQILHRQAVVTFLYEDQVTAEKIREVLVEVADIERIIGRLSVGLGSGARLHQLRWSLESCLQLKKIIETVFVNESKKNIKGKAADSNHSPELLHILLKTWNAEIKLITNLIQENIAEGLSENQVSGVIKTGVSPELDKLRNAQNSGEEWLAQFEEDERKKSGIGSLKCRYNQVFGYYIEISKSNLSAVPDRYIRKQTLVNAERFITPELKEHEELMLTAQSKIEILEKNLYENIAKQVLAKTKEIQASASSAAQLDCLSSLAFQARRQRYVAPIITDKSGITIKGGRHPVVETTLSDIPFVPNNAILDTENQQLHVITGPNMAGKSVFMRQVAIMTLLAHIGSYVSADQAEIGVVDRIFIRSGASDGITAGLSTFMVEMVETAHILKYASGKSLVIMDEIGRGTSTFDGISIAWAVAESLVTRPPQHRPMVLFATHYHELQLLENLFPNSVKNYTVSVSETSGKPIFLHLVIPGSASHSYGIAVAEMAGVPEDVIAKAQIVLETLEKEGIQGLGQTSHVGEKKTKRFKNRANKLSKKVSINKYFNDELNNLSISKLTPLEALNLLSQWQKKIKNNVI